MNDAPEFDALKIMTDTMNMQRELGIAFLGGEENYEKAYQAVNAKFISMLPPDYPRIPSSNPAMSELATAFKYEHEQKLAALPEEHDDLRQELKEFGNVFVRQGNGVSDPFLLLDTSLYLPSERLHWEAKKLAILDLQRTIARDDVAEELRSFTTEEMLRKIERDMRKHQK